MYSEDQIVSDSKLALSMDFDVIIDEINGEIVVDSPIARWLVTGDDADDLLDLAQELADANQGVTCRIAVLHIFYQKYKKTLG